MKTARVEVMCLIFLALSSPLFSASQESPYLIRNWREISGLPQNSVNAIGQTRDGYLWLATYGGLARFDGIRFTVFDVASNPELKTSRFINLIIDRQDGLWVVPEEALGVFRYDRGRFRQITIRDGLPANRVESILADREGQVWVGTSAGLVRITAAGMNVFNRANGLEGDQVLCLYEDFRGDIWVGTDLGLSHLRGGVLEPVSRRFGLGGKRIDAISGNAQGELWLWADNRLIFISAAGEANHFPLPGKRYETAPVGSEGKNPLYTDRFGQLWIGTTAGLLRWHEGQWLAFDRSGEFGGSRIKSVFMDREDNIWVGSDGGGLSQIKEGSIRAYGEEAGLPGTSIVPICGDGRGGIWIGATCGGLYHMKGDAVSRYAAAEGLKDYCVWSILLDRRGILWVGTWGGGIYQVQKGKATRFPDNPALASNIIHALFEDRDGAIWIGTENGLNVIANGRVSRYQLQDGLVHNNVKFITQDRSGAIWIATLGGISRWYKGAFRSYTSKNGLSHDYVRAIYEDRDGVIWIGTYGGGLNRLKDRRFFHFNTRNGLYDNVISRILEDDQGNLWMTCNRGIYRSARRELNDYAEGRSKYYNCYNYGSDEGMRSNECNGGGQPAGWRSADGRLWFPTIKGLVMIDPGRGGSTPPAVVIERMTVDSNEVDLGREIRLPPGKKRFDFQYTGFSFRAPEKVRFRYQLVGFDGDWIQAGTSRTVSYTNLPYGRYVFRVIACNYEGIWNETETTLTFYLRPFFYQTRLFLAACAAFLLLGVVGIYRLRLGQLRAREKALTKLVDERTQDLNLAMAELERLSLTDALTQLPNRRHFELIFAQEWKRCIREANPLTLLMVDIDFFKLYNDGNGHLQGDECLKLVAAAIRRCTSRAGDFVARLGGEEFVVILPNTAAAGASLLAERVRESVEELRIAHPSSTVSAWVTISVGSATLVPAWDEESERLIAAADRALYLAKSQGRNRISVAEERRVPGTDH